MKPLASEPPIVSPYLTPQEAADYLRYASVRALYKAIPVAGIPTLRRGRSLLFHREQLDRWLAGERPEDLRREARRRHEGTVPRPMAWRPSKSIGGPR